ncbi:MAG TPA: hypothetical protein VKS81_10795, partial [Bacteroidota bacterium]|nr:hypothetical protein [Bacteroidota bacterium]
MEIETLAPLTLPAFKRDLISYAAMAVVVFAWGSLYGILRYEGIDHWLIFVAFLLSALVTGHLSKKRIDDLFFKFAVSESSAKNLVLVSPRTVRVQSAQGKKTIRIIKYTTADEINSVQSILNILDFEQSMRTGKEEGLPSIDRLRPYSVVESNAIVYELAK